MSQDDQRQKLHPLKDKWFIFYQPAQAKVVEPRLDELDYVSSIEELFAMLNTLPALTILPVDDSLFISRNKAVPRFENFPGGCRISLFTKTKSQANDVVLRVLAAVVGEAVSKSVTEGEPVCDIIRMTHKLNYIYPETARVDVWCRARGKASDTAEEQACRAELEMYFTDLVKLIPGVSLRMSNIDG